MPVYLLESGERERCGRGHMASKQQMTGMLGVYLVAAELTRRDLITSITTRSARGADLLATDSNFKRTWSIQVKTNRKRPSFWLLGKCYKEEVSESHIYIFVNLGKGERPEYLIVPSKHVAKFGITTPPRSTGSIWHAFDRASALPKHLDPMGWKIFE